MLEELRKRLAAKLEARKAVQANLDTLITTCDTEKRSEFTDDEATKFAEYRTSLSAFDAAEGEDSIPALEARIAPLVEVEENRKRVESIVIPEGARITVGSEHRTYEAGNREVNFLRDAYRARFSGDRDAEDRIYRNRIEVMTDLETRAGTTPDYGTLVIPQYLTEEFAAVLRSGRPTITAIGVKPLPDSGMNLYIPRGSTGTLVAPQATENTSVTNQSYTENDLTVPVRTFGGQQLVSRQAVERGEGIGEILMSDLASSYATQVNLSILNDSGASGTHFGIVSGTTGTLTGSWIGTTGASLVASIYSAAGKVNAQRFQAADLIVMHPRRWAWICAQSDTAGRPLVTITGQGFNVDGQGVVAGYGPVGSIGGLPVVTDAGITTTAGAATNEDRIIVTRKEDLRFWEDSGAPRDLRFEEVLGDQLTIRLVTFGYSAFTAGRYPVATAVISGTGFTQVLT